MDFLLLGTVNTWAMDRGRVVHECVHVNTHAHICVLRLHSPGVLHAAVPDVFLPNATQTKPLAVKSLAMQCLC